MKIRALLFVVMFILVGCGQPTISHETRVIEEEDLYDLMVGDYNLVPSRGSSIADRYYLVPALSWYQAVFHPAVQKRLAQKGWVAESGDCDDFALVADSVASELNWNHGKASLPVGPIYYIRDDLSSGHAVIVLVYDDDGKDRVTFYEPQSGGRFFDLSKTEAASCSFWQF